MGLLLAQQEADTNVSVTGGVGAFLAMFLLALAVWALGWSMTRHLRRVNYLERSRHADSPQRGERSPTPAPERDQEPRP